MYPIRKVTKNSHVNWNVKIVESRKLSQFSPRIAANANCSVVSESQYRIMHTDKSRRNPWALTSNTVVFETQTFRLQRRCISLTEKWLTSSVIPTLGKWCLGKCQIVKTVQKYTVCVCVCVCSLIYSDNVQFLYMQSFISPLLPFEFTAQMRPTSCI